MTMYKALCIVLFCILKITTIATEDIATKNETCKENETYDTCASSCPMTCKNMFMPKNCNKMCNIRCDCDDGFARNNDGVCIQWMSCPEKEIECPENQEYTDCVSRCNPHTCSNIYGSCKPIVCFGFTCWPGCRCKEGYVFAGIESSSKCILIKECPSKCPEDEVESDCAKGCQPTCANPEPSEPCTSEDYNPGPPECICKPDLVRDERTNKCLNYEQCSMDGTTEE